MLGIPRSASSGEIRKSYKKLSLAYHPDKSKEPDARQKFAAISIAYQVRTDAALLTTEELLTR